MILPIRLYGDPVLRRAARPVTEFSDDLNTLAENMFETMYNANGVGLAAPQVGQTKRMFVALELAPKEKKEEEAAEEESELSSAEEKRERWGVVAEHVMVNPEIVSREGVQHAQDGCLSVPGIYIDEMKRDHKITVRYQDVEGKEHERSSEGHFAHVIQHELDHLDGLLFFDRLEEAERRRFMQEHRRELAQLQRDAKALLKRLRDEPLLAEAR